MTDTWGPRTAGRPFANHECIPMIVILHLGSHSGRGHPICSPFSKGGTTSLTQVGSMRRLPTSLFNHRTHRRTLDTQTLTTPLPTRPLALPLPPSLPLLVRWLLWERTDVVKAGCVKYLLYLLYCKRVVSRPCAGSVYNLFPVGSSCAPPTMSDAAVGCCFLAATV